MKGLYLFFMLLFTSGIHAQGPFSGHISKDLLGYELDVPEGWTAFLADSGLALFSHKYPHEGISIMHVPLGEAFELIYSVEHNKPFSEDVRITSVDSSTVSFTSLFTDNSVKQHVNVHVKFSGKTNAVAVMAISLDTSQVSAAVDACAEQVMRSVRIHPYPLSPSEKEWMTRLSNINIIDKKNVGYRADGRWIQLCSDGSYYTFIDDNIQGPPMPMPFSRKKKPAVIKTKPQSGRGPVDVDHHGPCGANADEDFTWALSDEPAGYWFVREEVGLPYLHTGNMVGLVSKFSLDMTDSYIHLNGDQMSFEKACNDATRCNCK